MVYDIVQPFQGWRELSALPSAGFHPGLFKFKPCGLSGNYVIEVQTRPGFCRLVEFKLATATLKGFYVE